MPPHGPAWPCRHAPDRRREGRVGHRYWRTRSLASWGAREVSRSALQHDRPPPLLQQSRGSPAALERRRIPWWPRVSRPPSPSPLHQVQRRLECDTMIRSPVCQHHLEDSKYTQRCLDSTLRNFFFLILLNLCRRRWLMELYRFRWYGSVIQHPSNESLCQRAQEASENGTRSVRGFRCAAGVRKGLRRGSDAFGRCKAPNEFSLALRPSRFPLVSMFKGFNPANVKMP